MIRSRGNMYEWVTHTHTHIGGECPHRCVYCYVDNPRFGRPEKYRGSLRLLEGEFKDNYGNGNVIFLEHCNDLFSDAIPKEWVERILKHCNQFPHNKYVFQTKNPKRILDFSRLMPPNYLLGITAETNRNTPEISTAPCPRSRLLTFRGTGPAVFITVEPVLKFDLKEFSDLIIGASPQFVNIGADSKNHGLEEPTYQEVIALADILKSAGIEIREKKNLGRLKAEHPTNSKEE